MQQSSSWETNSRSATCDTSIPCILWDCVQKSLSPVHILSAMNQVQVPTTYLFEIHSNIIMTHTPRRLFLQSFSVEVLCPCLISPVHSTCPVDIILLDFITLIIFGKKWAYGSLRSLLHNCLQPPALPRRSKYTSHKPWIYLTTLWCHTVRIRNDRFVFFKPDLLLQHITGRKYTSE
jgi:hypothetical protein